MMKRYKVGGLWFWFNEGEQPEGAIAEDEQPTAKQVKPANKSRTPRTKAANSK